MSDAWMEAHELQRPTALKVEPWSSNVAVLFRIPALGL